ncbi:MAG: DUF3568 domain-containing protein [Candidatus Omnitrophica bacterium]|nr:DUF3568 domain-containing protein [Candidatus Omnitrophota bacterium]MCG2707901.1 DUF3568 domain-containing protein [Candidatus Omnitrophota bacterium]
MRRIFSLVFFMLFLVNIYGCAAVIAGAAGTAGTAKWLSGKLTQQVNTSSEKSLEAVRTALKSFEFDITKETITEDIIQVKSNYTDGRTIWIDIRPTSTSSSQIDVRIGAMSDKDAAQKILDRILRYL